MNDNFVLKCICGVLNLEGYNTVRFFNRREHTHFVKQSTLTRFNKGHIFLTIKSRTETIVY